MSFNYADQFSQFLAQKYEKELTSYDLQTSNPQVQFINAHTIKLPRLTLSGYKDHTRGGAYNSGTLTNDWEPKTLAHDRDIEYIIDPMDIDETNLAVSVANIQNVFETEHAIPEKDSYRYSKIYSELNTYKAANIVSGTPSENNILSLFDNAMEKMDDAGVPSEGRILYATPLINRLLKTADGIQRQISVQGSGGVSVSRTVHNLDDVKIQVVPAARMKTAYNFTDGCVAATGAKQMYFILIHPSAVVCRDKYAYIKLFTPGSDSRTADNYIYQNRSYGDLFLIQRKADGAYIYKET